MKMNRKFLLLVGLMVFVIFAGVFLWWPGTGEPAPGSGVVPGLADDATLVTGSGHMTAVNGLSEAWNKLDARNADAFNNLGLACKRLGLTREAGQAFQSCVKVNARYVPGLINLGAFHFDVGNLEAAEQCLLQALKVEPNSQQARRFLSRVRSMDRQK